jgi:acyl-CoA synthetase (AMP-forming)/AMP-acid ligase II
MNSLIYCFKILICIVLCFICLYVYISLSNLQTLRRLEKICNKCQIKNTQCLHYLLRVIQKRIHAIHRKTFTYLNIQEIYESAKNLAGDTSSEDNDNVEEV